MGSRAVLLVCRVAAGGGAPASASPRRPAGAVWTRTGRPFFPPPLTAALLDRVRDGGRGGRAVRRARHVLAAPGRRTAALERQGRAAAQATSTRPSARPPGPRCPAAASALEQAAARGLPDVGELLDRTRSRLANADAFTAAYLRYCWATDGLAGVRVAPFQLLATEGAVYHDRPHLWHLALADRLAAATRR